MRLVVYGNNNSIVLPTHHTFTFKAFASLSVSSLSFFFDIANTDSMAEKKKNAREDISPPYKAETMHGWMGWEIISASLT